MHDLGLLFLGRRDDRPFYADDRSFLDGLMGLCALALERLRLFAAGQDSHCCRARQTQIEDKGVPRLRIGDLEIDLEEQRITIGSRPAALRTPSAFRCSAP